MDVEYRFRILMMGTEIHFFPTSEALNIMSVDELMDKMEEQFPGSKQYIHSVGGLMENFYVTPKEGGKFWEDNLYHYTWEGEEVLPSQTKPPEFFMFVFRDGKFVRSPYDKENADA